MNLNDPCENVPVESGVLEKLRIGAYTRLSQELVNTDVEVAIDLATKDILLSTRHLILAQRLDEKMVRYPATWWQHFKQTFFPYWLLKRFPVIEKDVLMKLYGAYPKAKLPKLGIEHLVIRIEGEE